MNIITTCDTSNVPKTWVHDNGLKTLTIITKYYLGCHQFVDMCTNFDAEGNRID